MLLRLWAVVGQKAPLASCPGEITTQVRPQDHSKICQLAKNWPDGASCPWEEFCSLSYLEQLNPIRGPRGCLMAFW